MAESITIRPAYAEEVQVIASMWDEVSRWLKSQGSDQWQYPPDLEKITRDVKRGTAYIAHRNGTSLGTITVDETADPEFWTADDRPHEALYGHRIIVLPEAQGERIGTSLLDWASLKAQRNGKRWFRVDAWKTSEALRLYYLRHDFEHVRTVDLPHRRSGALYQRAAGVLSGDGPPVVRLETPTFDSNGYPLAEGTGGRTSLP